MSDAVQFQISSEQLSALSDKLVSAWMLDELPYDVKNTVSRAIAEKVASSEEWEKLAAAITEKFSGRRDEIANRIVTGMIEQLSRGIVEAVRKCTEELSKRMANVRIY